MARTVTITFGDGSQHVYENVPDNVTPEQVQARAGNDFPGKSVAVIDGGRGEPQERSLGEQLGAGARNVIEGAAQGAGTLVDPFIQAAGGAVRAVGNLVGSEGMQAYQPATIAGTGQQLASAAGLPESTGAAAAIQRGAIAGLTGAGAAGLLARGATGATQSALQALAANPLAEAAAGAGAMGAQQAVADAGGSTSAQLAAGLVGGVGGGAAGLAAPAVAQRVAQSAPVQRVAQVAEGIAERVRPSTAAEPAAQAAPVYRPVAPEILNAPAVRIAPSETAVNREGVAARDAVLDAIGIPADSRRLGAQTGNRRQINEEVTLSKLDGAERMRDQFNLEGQKLAEYATAIQRDTGGTIGASPLERGQAISEPLEAYQQWYKQQIRQVYDQANEAAAGQGGIELSRLKAFLDEPANFKGDGITVQRDMLNELKRLGVMDKDGNLAQVDARIAERIRQSANDAYDPLKPQTQRAVSALKEALDEDVISVLPADVYQSARAMNRQYHEIFSDPKGIAQILQISGPDGINRAISLDVLPDRLAQWAGNNSAQFRNVIKTLESLPTPELQEAGARAVAEARAHIVEKIIGKSVDMTEAALGAPASWRGTDDTLEKLMKPYKGKLANLLGRDLADRLETLKVGARILRPYDPNPSGSPTTQFNIEQGITAKAAEMAGAGIGALLSSPGGPLASIAGGAGGKQIAKSGINYARQRTMQAAIEKSLNQAKKANQF